MGDKLPMYEKVGRVIRLLGWIQIIVFVILSVYVFISMVLHKKAMFFGFFSVPILFLISLLFLIVGKAVKNHQNWGRIAGIVLGVSMLVGFPLGTLVGGYILWGLIKGWE